ncbi:MULTISPECIES: MAPEG family protein [Gammaproteobacteria]|uniref:MAPEG family protein n=1 Tax=Gammaproteobacteria TaxID=1236 RepID=UPI001911A303|nr:MULTISPECIES: MAPEG family protein [Gammaproteobacteria]MBK5303246.1 MAPEG family protein [Bacillus sp. TH86]MBK5323015.1 MAPEG family protein [Bacillus sp. TH59]MBK5337965.1 MAPEG family protein [Bacillus sp. TH57]MBK5312020.1 MAPEG family protein [Pseudomonas sp. TH71]MBK5317514.1 MAPEG family protein [Erwinia sp. TH79]
MTVALWCVLIAICLPYLCTGVAKFSGGKFGLKQNHDPRAFLDSLEGVARRAHSAQLNSFEVTPAFAAAVIVAHLAGNADLVTINVLAVLFITSRLLYIICYLADWAILRSLVWAIGMGLIGSFFVVSV